MTNLDNNKSQPRFYHRYKMPSGILVIKLEKEIPSNSATRPLVLSPSAFIKLNASYLKLEQSSGRKFYFTDSNRQELKKKFSQETNETSVKLGSKKRKIFDSIGLITFNQSNNNFVDSVADSENYKAASDNNGSLVTGDYDEPAHEYIFCGTSQPPLFFVLDERDKEYIKKEGLVKFAVKFEDKIKNKARQNLSC
jgi:hypothetical protein